MMSDRDNEQKLTVKLNQLTVVGASNEKGADKTQSSLKWLGFTLLSCFVGGLMVVCDFMPQAQAGQDAQVSPAVMRAELNKMSLDELKRQALISDVIYRRKF